MAVLHFVVKGWTVWAGLLTLALGLLLGLREPMPQGVLLIGMGALAFVACLIGRLLLATYLRNTQSTWNRRDRHGISPKG
jgi:hypothetical protein